MRESSVRPAHPADLRHGDGVLVALASRTGRRLWSRRLGSPPTGCATVSGDVVFVPTLAGRLLAFRTSDGRLLWQTHARAGINGCPSVGEGLLLLGAGAPKRDGRAVPELTAYGLPGSGP
jgi:outer membrane protein assembly factor BamB